eukprot:11147222-Ditylum_brightwellii.AAC.1
MQWEADLVTLENGNLLSGIPTDIVGAVATMSIKNTTVLHAAQREMGIKMQQQGQTPWEAVRLTRIKQSGEKEDGQ